jgi:UDP-N-acetylmuramoylalanine--D-glutamate ligase
VTPVTTFAGRRVALFGLGGSGLATARALAAGGAAVVAHDDDPKRVAAAAAEGIGTGDLRGADWAGFAALVLSPGVPLTHPEPHWTVGLARAAGIEVIGDVELFCRERARIAPGSDFVAITGTNGKSTTTALVAHVLRQAGRDVQVGGNIGTAVLSLAPPARDRVHVVEMSSFQIDLTPSLEPSVGVHINLSPDHLDRHGTMEAYAAIKERLVAGADLALVGVDDAPSAAIAGRLDPSRCRPVSVERPLDRGIALEGTRLVLDGARVLADVAGLPTLRGLHNAQNAAFAAGVADALGLDRAAIQAGLASFPGLAHRLEAIGRVGPALFVNDSKATNADSTEKALAAYPEAIFWIVGGKAKEGGIAPLAGLFPRVAKAYLIGASSDDFAAALEGRVAFERCGTLEVAVGRAAADAAASSAREPVVLLSPACASYDQFRNFEERGERFRALVAALPGLTPGA